MTAPLDGIALEPLTAAHLDAVFALYADPRVWTHQPDGRHVDRAQSARVVTAAERSREATGLGPWAVVVDGRFAGTAGVHCTDQDVWNLGFRLHPDVQGRGIASAVSRLAMTEAASRRPVAVVARVLESNPASIRVLERVGLALVWSGAAVATDGSARPRRVYADRTLPAALLDELVGLG